jgi:flagellar protein FliO/FliZ
MNSRLILASAFILSLALPQAACASAPPAAAPAATPAAAPAATPAAAPAATPAATRADQERLLAAERARLEAARAELAAQSAAPTPALPAQAGRAAAGNQPAAPVSSDLAGAPAVPPPADSSTTAPDASGAQPHPPATAARAPAQPPAPLNATGPVGGPSAGSLLQTILALAFVLALLAGLAWFMKRFGPKAAGGTANLRIVGSLNLGGRERLMVVEVGNQWIVVGASPGRVNALATMPKQEGAEQSATLAGHMPTASSFGEWLKQTIDKRNGK